MAVDILRIASLRRQGRSWAQIKADTGISRGTAQRAMAGLPKTLAATPVPKCLICCTSKVRILTARNLVVGSGALAEASLFVLMLCDHEPGALVIRPALSDPQGTRTN